MQWEKRPRNAHRQDACGDQMDELVAKRRGNSPYVTHVTPQGLAHPYERGGYAESGGGHCTQRGQT